MKKIFALILALAMVMGLAVSASAAKITITPADDTLIDNNTAAETYKAYKIFDATISGDNVAYTIMGGTTNKNQFYDVVDAYTYKIGEANIDVFTLDQINDTDVYNVRVDEAFMALSGDAADAAAKDLAAKLKSVATNHDAISNEKAEIEVGTGYYLITSSLGSALIVDTYNGENITIETKNEYPSLTKVADKATAAYGETVTYTVTVTIPATAVGEITVTDTMTNLTYVALAEGTTAGITGSANGKVITFTIPETVVADNLGGSVIVKYTATVDANKTTAENKAYLEYSNFKSNEVETKLANYKVEVFKYTGTTENKTGLAGAGFVLKNTEGKYYKLTDGIVSWVDSIDDASEYVTAEGESNYTVTFEGLANGTYTLVEKTVPAGYNKANDTQVTITGADFIGNGKIEVLNSTGSELPSTGGMGTTIFYVVGGLLTVGAVVLLVTKKRMSV